MTKRSSRKRRSPAVGDRERDEMLDMLLAYDRGVVEFSMGLYNVGGRDRDAIREQNRRLHDAVRKSASDLRSRPSAKP